MKAREIYSSLWLLVEDNSFGWILDFEKAEANWEAQPKRSLNPLSYTFTHLYMGLIRYVCRSRELSYEGRSERRSRRDLSCFSFSRTKLWSALGEEIGKHVGEERPGARRGEDIWREEETWSRARTCIFLASALKFNFESSNGSTAALTGLNELEELSLFDRRQNSQWHKGILGHMHTFSHMSGNKFE